MKHKAIGLRLLVAAVLVGGCEVRHVAPPPTTLDEYETAKRSTGHPYPDRVVATHNLQRVLDGELAEAQRRESLRVVARLGREDRDARSHLAGLLGDGQAPEGLQNDVLQVLLDWGHGDLRQHVMKVVPKLDPQSPMKGKILEWLTVHKAPGVLGDIVRLWAREPSSTGIDEPRYRQTVERLSGKKWFQALLDGVNTRGFQGRGSAMRILAARLPAAELRQRVAALPTQTDAVETSQVFLNMFGYLPTDGASLLQSVWLYAWRHRNQPAVMEDAARLAGAWRESFGYRFDVRDFHLLSKLARDPLRKKLRRSQLVMELARSFIKRRHVAGSPAGAYAQSDRLSRHIESLTMADLWNLRLLDEMLNRPRVQMALSVMAARDRADTQGAWGGQVIYENGQAEAKLYDPPHAGAGDDLTFVPTRRAVVDGRDALCRYYGHFERADNLDRAGPTAPEMAEARRANFYGLVVTSLSDGEFCAHYHNPKGVVISLGRFPFRELPAPGK